MSSIRVMIHKCIFCKKTFCSPMGYLSHFRSRREKVQCLRCKLNFFNRCMHSFHVKNGHKISGLDNEEDKNSIVSTFTPLSTKSEDSDEQLSNTETWNGGKMRSLRRQQKLNPGTSKKQMKDKEKYTCRNITETEKKLVDSLMDADSKETKCFVCELECDKRELFMFHARTHGLPYLLYMKSKAKKED